MSSALKIALAAFLWADPWLTSGASVAAWGGPPPPATHIEDLERSCRPLWGTLPANCLAALDRLYADRDVTRNWHSEPRRDSAAGPRRPWVPLPLADRIVWRDVFADPLALRRAVDEAAADVRCRAMPGESRPELRVACAADAFARLSVLHRACGWILRWDGSEHHDGWAVEWERERGALDENARDGGDRASGRATLAESELHFAWRLRQCRLAPSAAMSRVFALRRPPHHSGRSQHTELLHVAARLGSPWANAQAGAVPEDVNATATWDLPLAYIRRAAGAALGHNASASMYLPYLLVARDYDLRLQARMEWGGLEQRFSGAELDVAHATALRILDDGWRPMAEPLDRDSTWPWAVAPPPVVETRYIGRRYDRYGNVRWVYPSGVERWFAPDGSVESEYPDEDEPGSIVVYHTQIDTAGRVVRRWTDEAGNERWTDQDGHEHWVDSDGAERWVDWGGTEWVLLPIGVPLPEDAE